MMSFRRLLAVFLTIALLIPAAALGEAAEAPGWEEAAESSEVETAIGETTMKLGETGGAENAEPVPQHYEETVDPTAKAPTFTVSVGDTLRLRVSGADSAAWKPGKAGYVTIAAGADEAGPYVDVRADREIKKLKLTAA